MIYGECLFFLIIAKCNNNFMYCIRSTILIVRKLQSKLFLLSGFLSFFAQVTNLVIFLGYNIVNRNFIPDPSLWYFSLCHVSSRTQCSIKDNSFQYTIPHDDSLSGSSSASSCEPVSDFPASFRKSTYWMKMRRIKSAAASHVEGISIIILFYLIPKTENSLLNILRWWFSH